ncbi:MAG: type II restriction endonuclease [Novosphingobium sp.]|nr:type II restriction endonuclease [Novosphingobium sp.]
MSTNQTDEMQTKRLQLVVPGALHATYQTAQQAWLMDVARFIALARARQ